MAYPFAVNDSGPWVAMAIILIASYLGLSIYAAVFTHKQIWAHKETAFPAAFHVFLLGGSICRCLMWTLELVMFYVDLKLPQQVVFLLEDFPVYPFISVYLTMVFAFLQMIRTANKPSRSVITNPTGGPALVLPRALPPIKSIRLTNWLIALNGCMYMTATILFTTDFMILPPLYEAPAATDLTIIERVILFFMIGVDVGLIVILIYAIVCLYRARNIRNEPIVFEVQWVSVFLICVFIVRITLTFVGVLDKNIEIQWYLISLYYFLADVLPVCVVLVVFHVRLPRLYRALAQPNVGMTDTTPLVAPDPGRTSTRTSLLSDPEAIADYSGRQPTFAKVLEGMQSTGGSVDDSILADVPGTQAYSASLSPPSNSLRHRRSNSIGSVRGLMGDDVDRNLTPNTLEERHKEINALFGIKPWKSHVAYKPMEEHSEVFRALYNPPVESAPTDWTFVTIDSVTWVVLFGWWIAVIYFLFSCLLYVTVVGNRYAHLCYNLAFYHFFPFGHTLERLPQEESEGSDSDESVRSRTGSVTSRTGRATLERRARVVQAQNVPYDSPTVDWIAWGVFTFVFAPLLWLMHMFVAGVCWFVVVLIPMAKVHKRAAYTLFESPGPLSMAVINGSPHVGADVIVCTYHAASRNFFKYSYGGMNVCLVNMMPFIVLTLFLGYVTPHIGPLKFLHNDMAIFTCSLFSVIPLAYYIGTAISSLSAQSSFAVGAVLNATFGSLVEVILYFKLLVSDFSDVVTMAVIGSLLGTLLLMPGLSMVIGGLKYTNQYFNPIAAGVSSVLLIVAIVGAFTPTFFYRIRGSYTLLCTACSLTNTTAVNCGGCTYEEINPDDDPVYRDKARPLMYACSAIMPIAYIVGLVFTLRTHKHIYEAKIRDDDEEEHAGGHDAPEWSNIKCIVVLCVSTVIYALIAELMVDSLSPVLAEVGLSASFVGLTIIALIPNTAEFINAIQFALQDNLALAIEVGSSAAVQITLIQMPLLVFFSAVLMDGKFKNSFTLIFDELDVFASFFAVLVVNYQSIAGKSNYFNGTGFLCIYALLISAYYFN